jgi:hypothetical protein
VTNTYANRLRTILTLQQAPGRPLWTNAFGYDAAGRLTNVTSPAGSFSYILGGASSASRLTKKLLLPNTSYITNTFDPVARLTGTYLYDGNLVIQERNGLPTVTYTRGPDLSGTMQGAGGIGGLLARFSGYSSGNWTTHHSYHADANGNVAYLVDSSQAMAATYRYDPFGKTLSSRGSLAGANVYRGQLVNHACAGLFPNDG